MRKLLLPIFVLSATTALACTFQAGTEPKAPPPPAPAPVAVTPLVRPGVVAPAATAIPHPRPRISVSRLGHAKPALRPAGTPGLTPAAPVAPPGSPPLMAGTNAFGNGTFNADGYKGALYNIPAGTTALPKLDAMSPLGFFFTPTLNTTAQTLTGGFPGIDATKNENFAIRYEAPLVVDTEADYSFRVVSDDGSMVDIDDTLIVNNDGVRTAPAEKSGPVHLIVGTHVITVDYFQSTAGVALQLYCTKAGGTEQVCPTHLK